MKYLFLLNLLLFQCVLSQTPRSFSNRQQVLHHLFSNGVTTRAVDKLENSLGESTYGKKSVSLAVLYSLLLPGMGELYAGEYRMGKYFTIAEGVLWITLGSFHWYGNWLQDDARLFAAQHAQFQLEGKSDQFFIDIGNDNDIFSFNERMLRNRNEHRLYDESQGSPDYWKWDSDANRGIYRSRRISSENVFNDTRFVAAAIAINHVVSAINAARLTLSHNKNIGQSELLNIRAKVMGGLTHPEGIMVTFSKSF